MKNIRNIMVAVAALVSAASMASVVQPAMPVSESNPVRISAGIVGGLWNGGAVPGFGMSDLGFGLGFAHNVGYDFEYGVAIGGGWATTQGKLFTDAAKEKSGFRLDVELMARFMPEVAESFRLGGALGVGYGRQFGKATESLYKAISFGDLNFFVGPSASYSFTDMFSMYFAPALTMTAIRFGADKAPAEWTDKSNLLGMQLPVGFWFAVADTTAIYLEANTKFGNFKSVKDSFKEEVTLGVSFAI